jgi:DNA-directed RNA polymerase subunit RPC12/RpoP
MLTKAIIASLSHRSKEKVEMVCPKCQSWRMHRRRREGFVELKVAPLFGYFPWRCSDCKAELFLRVRNERGVRRHRTRQSP